MYVAEIVSQQGVDLGLKREGTFREVEDQLSTRPHHGNQGTAGGHGVVDGKKAVVHDLYAKHEIAFDVCHILQRQTKDLGVRVAGLGGGQAFGIQVDAQVSLAGEPGLVLHVAAARIDAQRKPPRQPQVAPEKKIQKLFGGLLREPEHGYAFAAAPRR